jgi:electron transfer flavoprotein alpha subunit
MTILVIAEHDHASLKAATLNTVAAAQKIGGDIHLLVAGTNCNAAAQEAATLSGVSTVKVADAAHYQSQTAENLTALVIANAAGYSHILAPATTFGKNLMPRVAALLDVAQISEITGVESADTFVRPIYAGNALATVKSADAVKVITVRTTAFDAVNRENAAKIESISPAADTAQSTLTNRELTKSERPELGAAKIIVSGGRGLGSGENYHTCSNRSPTSSVPRLALPVPPSMRVSCRTTTRSARPARSSLRSCTSPSASPAPSSTWPA